MNYEILTISDFDRNLKKLSKKYHSIQKDVFELGEKLKINPTQGDKIFENCYKVRMVISSKNKGKSAGARVITYVYVTKETVYLLSIYDKSEQENLSDNEIKTLIQSLEMPI